MTIIFTICSFNIMFGQNICKCDSLQNISRNRHDYLPNYDIDYLHTFFATNIKYPQTAIADSIGGKVILQFWVNEDGSTSEHKILKGVREDIDEEVLSVAAFLKFKRPLINNKGEPVATCLHYTIKFGLSKKKPNCWQRFFDFVF